MVSSGDCMVVCGEGKLNEGSILRENMQGAYHREWLCATKDIIWICTSRRKHFLMEKEVAKFASKIEYVSRRVVQ